MIAGGDARLPRRLARRLGDRPRRRAPRSSTATAAGCTSARTRFAPRRALVRALRRGVRLPRTADAAGALVRLDPGRRARVPAAPLRAAQALASLLVVPRVRGRRPCARDPTGSRVHHAFRYSTTSPSSRSSRWPRPSRSRVRGRLMHPISYAQAIVARPAAGRRRAVSGLEPRPQCHRAAAARLGHPPAGRFFLTFLVATHLATALVLFGFFWRDWIRIVAGLGARSAPASSTPGDPDARLGWLLVIGTIPAGILGLLLRASAARLFASPTAAALFLFCNGLMLFAAEHWRRSAPVRQDARFSDERIATSSSPAHGGRRSARLRRSRCCPASRARARRWPAACAPGLSNEDAARFSFLLATPVIGAAARLQAARPARPPRRRRPRPRARRRAVRGA